MLCSEVLRERKVEESRKRVVEKRVEENDYLPPCLDVFKIM